MKEQQKLIDIMFDLVLSAHSWESFQSKSINEIAEWVASNLKECGFDTKPIGSSWGVLINNK